MGCKADNTWQALHGDVAGAGYVPNAVEFDGVNDYLDGIGSIAPDSKTWTGSFWLYTADFSNFDPVGFSQIFNGATNQMVIRLDDDGSVHFIAENASDVEILDLSTAPSVHVEGVWQHFLFSFDLANPASPLLYINDVNVPLTNNIFIDDFIEASIYEVSWGGGHTGLRKHNGYSADVWIDFGTYIDLSDAAERAKFIDANGNPVFLGADGSLPTGSAPDIFLSGDTDTWHQNKNTTAGGFTENGTLTTASTSPYQHSTGDFTSGLIAHWTMDEASGNIVDAVNGLVGTPGGTITYGVPGIVGNAIEFTDAGNGEFNVGSPAILDNVKPVSFAFWIKPTNDTPFDQNIIRKSSIYTGFGLRRRGSTLHFRRTNELEGQRSENYIWVDEWKHVVLTWDGSMLFDGVDIYVNGEEVLDYDAGEQTNGTSIEDNSSRDFFIGDVALSAVLDDIRIYDRALSADDVKALYHQQASALTGYFVLVGNQPTNAEVNEFTGDLGGLSGADATCLNFLTTYDWVGKTSALERGMLTADNVQAWLCDDTTCRDIQPNTRYAFATTQADLVFRGGGTFITDASGFYPAANPQFWWYGPYFARNTFFWTGRNADFTPSGNNCNGWTSTAGNGTRGKSQYTDNRRWSNGTQACTTTDQFVCVVNPRPAGICKSPSGDMGEITYNASERIFQGCTAAGWKALHEAGTGGGGCSSPSGATGEIIYNSSEDVYQGCTEDGWMTLHQ